MPTQHAQKIQCPQFREALLRIGEDEARHDERIAEKINVFGGSLPGELTIQSTEKNIGTMYSMIWKRSGDVLRI